jgi:hypothetical protein
MATNRSLEAREATAERRARAVEARRQHLTFAEIGAELGVSTQRAHEIYLDALEAIPAKQVELHRAEATELAHTAIDDLLIIARDHKQPRTSVEAWGQIRGWAERLARIQNTDTPVKVDATVTTAQMDPATAALIAEAQAAAEAQEAEIRARREQTGV